MNKNCMVFKIEPPAEITANSIKEYIGKCTSQVRGVLPRNNDKLFKRLCTEAYGDTASRVLEYVPIVIPIERVNVYDFNKKFSFYKNGNYYTNLRNMINCKHKLEDVIHLIDFTEHRVIRVVAPLFVVNQMITHTQITSVMHSNRYTQSNYGYWYPKEFEGFYIGNGNLQDAWKSIVRSTDPDNLESFIKHTLGVKRREVHARGSDMLEFREVVLGGYKNYPLAWEWFINQRTKDKHTQLETRSTVEEIKKVIYNV
jgi:hypothetical protein